MPPDLGILVVGVSSCLVLRCSCPNFQGWIIPCHRREGIARLLQVKLLVDEGGAPVGVQDRWGKTAYDEARRVGATAVAEFLSAEMAKAPQPAMAAAQPAAEGTEIAAESDS